MNRARFFLVPFLLLLGFCSMHGRCVGDECPVGSQCRQSIGKNLDLFDRTMEPGYLDMVVKDLEKMADCDEQEQPVPEVRRYKLDIYFRMFRAVTEAIDPDYLPEMARMMMSRGEKNMPEKEPRPIPEKVASSYLYDYLQSGLRVFRFQIRLAILDYIRSAYRGVPSPEERREALALAEGVDDEFLALLRKFIQTDVSWRPSRKGKSPVPEDGKAEEEEMTAFLRHIYFLKHSRDPLYLSEDYGCMNISLPLLPGQDGFIVSGQSPDSVKNPEARRQYLIARKENGRKSRGVDLSRKAEEEVRNAQEMFFGKIKSSKWLDTQGGRSLLKKAAEFGMDAVFLDNLREELEIREIRGALARFRKTKTRADLDAACLLVHQFRRAREEAKGRWKAGSTFQLEKWLELYHVIAQEPSFEDGERIREDLEKKMMEHIWRTCSNSCSALREVGWWLRAYGMDKRLVGQVSAECQRVLTAQKQEIGNLLLSMELACTPEKVKQAARAIGRLTHRNSGGNGDIPSILDFKLHSWLQLMKMLEKNLDPLYKDYPERSLLFRRSGGNDGDIQPGFQKDLCRHHQDIRYSVESLVNGDYDGTPEIQQRALRMLEGMNVRPEFLNSCRHYFDTGNLRKSIQQLKEEGKGNPEQIWKDIQAWAEDEEAPPDWPYKCFLEKMSRQFSLFEAMQKSGNLGPAGFSTSFQEQIMAEIQETLPDDKAGRSALEEIFRRAGEGPLKDSVRELLENRMTAKTALFFEHVARFEETGSLESLDKAFSVLDYIIYGENNGRDERAVRREKTDIYLRLIRALDHFQPVDLVARQKLPPDQWGKGWNDKLPPLERMKLLLENRKDWVRSYFFSHIRYRYGATREELEEVRQLVRNHGMDEAFRKEVEERLTLKE
ncbi:hypothetical protein [Akkermansia sp.]|uniref:hypothetical protein n=1 Tax=Akkermansia sp. TaxID=1872421 RepID=UPI0025BE9415|nr:hypothetical protein [Akkermansia sp.]MCC8148607.1 hypothetical protein [Akkermansia sp.]